MLVCARNANMLTYDGIEVGGERVTREIEETLEELESKGEKIEKISMVGYSLGGLVARYACGLLYHKGWFDKIEPVNFTTFATPNLGVRSPGGGSLSGFYNIMGASTLATSGRQMFLIDNFRKTGRPLLSIMADPEAPFVKGLSRFQRRSLYANIINDKSVNFFTSSMSRTDPFVRPDELDIKYQKGYEPVIIDAEHPFNRKQAEEKALYYSRFMRETKGWIKNLPLVAFLCVFIPVGTIVFLGNAVVQTIRSNNRVRLHEAGKMGVTPDMYRLPLLQEAQHRVDNMYIQSAPSTDTYMTESDGTADGEKLQRTKSWGGDFPTLALTKEQFAMIDAMDQVGWKKYPVWIHNVRHSHAAIIRRMPKDSFYEGKTVVKHWVDHFSV